MITYINSKLPKYVIPVLIFCFVFLAGCGSSEPERETVDRKTLVEDKKDINRIYSFTLYGGKTYNDSLNEIGLDFTDKKDPRIVYYAPEIKTDTATYYTAKPYQSFSIFSVISADVLYRKSSSKIMPILGPIIGIGVLVFIFWANGERNKRK